jgi:hypothetical protein
MSRSRSLARVASGILPLLSAALLHCTGFGESSLGATACPQLHGAGSALGASYSADARASAKVGAFVQASKDLMNVSLQMEGEAAEACTRMGYDLGLSPAQMAPRDGLGGKAAGACGAAAARIDAILRQGMRVSASVTPPQCQASASAEAQCQGSCSATVTPAEIVARCEPARLSGMCQGRCTGRCDGTCRGDCNGQCAVRDAQGKCAGACSGDCIGACDATCHARCEGQWQAPRCEGSVQGPSADAECQGSCRAHADVQASCTPAIVVVQPVQGGDMALRLAATLQANLPLLLHAELALGRRLIGDVQVVGQIGAQLPRILGAAGSRALACVAAAADATASASARINVSVQASASVSGKVGG